VWSGHSCPLPQKPLARPFLYEDEILFRIQIVLTRLVDHALSPRSAHKGRTPPRLSPRHPTIRVISCSREGHDFTRARTYPASVIPSEVEGPRVLAKRGASSFFRALCEKGGRQHCRKARFTGRARLQSCHKHQKKDSGISNPTDRTESRSPAHLSSSPSAAL
jgi:hypothetical protein